MRKLRQLLQQAMLLHEQRLPSCALKLSTPEMTMDLTIPETDEDSLHGT
jgi:hypothetical protein